MAGDALRELSVKIAVPLRGPAFTGVKLKLSPQIAPAVSGNALTQVEVEFSVKFPPKFKASEPVKGWLPMFWTDTAFGLSPLELPKVVLANCNDGACVLLITSTLLLKGSFAALGFAGVPSRSGR